LKKKNKKILKISLITVGIIILLALVYCGIAIMYADDTVDCGDNIYCAPGMKPSMTQKVASGTKNIFSTKALAQNDIEVQSPTGKKIVEITYVAKGNGLYDADVIYNVPENYISGKSALANTYNVGMNVNVDTMMQDFDNIVSATMVGNFFTYTHHEMSSGNSYWHTSQTTYSDGSSRYNSYYYEDGELVSTYTEYTGDESSEAANDMDGDDTPDAYDDDTDGDGQKNDVDNDDDNDGTDDEDDLSPTHDEDASSDTGEDPEDIIEGTGIPSRDILNSFSDITNSISETLTSSAMTQSMIQLQTNSALKSNLIASLNTKLISGLGSKVNNIEVTSISYS